MDTNFLNKKYPTKSNHTTHSQLSSSSVSHMHHDPRPMDALTIICPSHSSEILTNYCANMRCLLPLCPDCIEPHMDQHKQTSKEFPEIESIKQARVKCAKKLQKLIEDLLREMGNLEPPKSMERVKADASAQLNSIKQVVLRAIDQYFMGLEEDIKYRVDQSTNLLKKIETSHLRMSKMVQELKNLDTVVRANDPATPGAIKKTLEINASSLVSDFNQQLQDYNISRKKIQINFRFDEQRFRKSIDETIQIEMIGSPTENSNTALMIEDNVKHSKPPVLHFFESGSSKLHLIELPNLNPKEVTLKQGWEVPQFHGSLLLTNRQIWLTGGCVPMEEDEISHNHVAKYDLNRGLFDPKFTTINARSSHSMCESNGFVYLVGGYNSDKDEETTLETINIQTGGTSLEKDSKFGGPNISLVLKGSIFKVSQHGVELYSINKNIWTQLYITNFVYYDYCAGINVNDREIFVFGGYQRVDEDNSPPVKISYIIDISDLDQLVARDYNIHNLVTPGGFKNNGAAVIFHKELYVLQNIESTNEDDKNVCFDDAKSLFSFNGKRWTHSTI